MTCTSTFTPADSSEPICCFLPANHIGLCKSLCVSHVWYEWQNPNSDAAKQGEVMAKLDGHTYKIPAYCYMEVLDKTYQWDLSAPRGFIVRDAVPTPAFIIHNNK